MQPFFNKGNVASEIPPGLFALLVVVPFAFYMELLWLGIFLGWLRGVGYGCVFGVVAFGWLGASFCGFLNMVTFDGDVGIVFVEAYNYLSELDILG